MSAAHLHRMRQQTITALHQHHALGTQARRLLAAAVNDAVIRLDDANAALHACHLEPLTARWTVRVDAEVTLSRPYATYAETADAIRQLIATASQNTVTATHIRHETTAGGGHPDKTHRQVTASVSLQTTLTAPDPYPDSYNRFTALRNKAAELGVELSIRRPSGPTDVHHDVIDAGPDLPAPVVSHLEACEDLTAITGAHERATTALTYLQRSIRHTAIRALTDGDLIGPADTAARQVDRFLTGLAMPGLPRAHHVTVTVTITMLVRAHTAQQALHLVEMVLLPTEFPDPPATRWYTQGAPDLQIVPMGDAWQTTWVHIYHVWLRGHDSPDAAGRTAQGLVRHHLDARHRSSNITLTGITVRPRPRGLRMDTVLDAHTD